MNVHLPTALKSLAAASEATEKELRDTKALCDRFRSALTAISEILEMPGSPDLVVAVPHEVQKRLGKAISDTSAFERRGEFHQYRRFFESATKALHPEHWPNERMPDDAWDVVFHLRELEALCMARGLEGIVDPPTTTSAAYSLPFAARVAELEKQVALLKNRLDSAGAVP